MGRKPLLAVTMGDPGGIGPEIAVRAVTDPAVRHRCRPVIIGDIGVLRKCLRFASPRIRLIPVHDLSGVPRGSAIPVLNPMPTLRLHRWGVVRAVYGRAAMGYISRAVSEALAGRVDGIVTAPICKESIHRAGFGFQGHTDYLASLTGAREHAMMLTGRGLRVVLATIHVGIRRVPRELTRAAVAGAIRMADGACRALGIRAPRIGVCGLNPHAGEAGAFGGEERTVIAPAIRAARRRGINARGPFPADTLFIPRNREQYDAIVAMYHDQGLIPLKALAFDVGVNVTLGLPIVRTSPDHGTAFDIAGRGRADHRSMIEAILLASRMTGRRHA
ncbi:MAG: 4-hydroxythreonine-4-phosphate dehydrogenase PdxA [Candidatus Aureabacteria bacterium]|nr:4-hydroxythreonine-4-phosphate dehydrogenase PdxA [Candidatus Auribacterota bacterium]